MRFESDLYSQICNNTDELIWAHLDSWIRPGVKTCWGKYFSGTLHYAFDLIISHWHFTLACLDEVACGFFSVFLVVLLVVLSVFVVVILVCFHLLWQMLFTEVCLSCASHRSADKKHIPWCFFYWIIVDDKNKLLGSSVSNQINCNLIFQMRTFIGLMCIQWWIEYKR